MPRLPFRCIALLLCLALSAPPQIFAADPAPAKQMDESKRAAHALNRLAFGPRPGDVERVNAMGVEKWIEQQLNPERIDDSALQARLQPYRTLQMSTREIVENYPPPQVLKAIAEGRMRMPSDPAKRAVYESQMEAYKARQARKAEDEGTPPPKNGEAVDEFFNEMDQGAKRKEAEQKANQLANLPPDQRFDAILRMPPQQRRLVAQALPPDERQKLIEGFSPEQREQLQAMARPQQVVTNELASAKVLRAVYSDRQLEEVMTDFWFNHFNVFINKGADRFLTTAYERDVIRKHALGKFEDLLVATAEHPAMLFYLDNFQSVGPDSPAGRGERGRGRNARFNQNKNDRRMGGNVGFGRTQRRGPFPDPTLQQQRRIDTTDREMQRMDEEVIPAPQPKRGLNENYARELMELHTLGVDGGYTQHDVTEVAKVFTGWTIRQPRQGGGFEFREQLHEPGSKTVLGKKISEGGQNEGKQVLHMLATHPSTAKFISKKLAMRFGADDPPAALVARMAATFTKTHGDIREVLRTLFKSPEFWAPETYRAKVKTPFEFVVSALRSTGADVQEPMQVVQQLNKMGMPLYGMQPPTGYSMKAETWVNSGALINRMNFSLALSSGRVRGIIVDPQRLAGNGTAEGTALTALSQSLLAGDISPQTQETVKKEMGNPSTSTPAMIAGLLMGSPEFQRR